MPQGTENQLIEHSLIPGWYFYFLIFLVLSYIIARIFLGTLSINTVQAIFRYNTASSMFNDNSQLQRQRDNVLYAFYFSSMAFFAMLTMQDNNIFPYDLSEYKLLIFNSLTLFGIFIFRVSALNVVGHIFDNSGLFREYLYHGFVINKFIGIAFIPLNFLIAYTVGVLQQISIYLAFSILILLLFIRIFRSVLFSIKKRVLNFYLFLYLCALEIVPLLLLYKWFTIIV